MPDKLAAARARIDVIDRKLSVLLSRRFALVAPLAALKPRIKDPARERTVLRNAARAGNKKFAAATRGVFSEIIRQAVLLQRHK
ncbi:MAG: chorismate mutase [Elusimicrobia bacterium]|nr:chorismate mutase [Elusimicrobiota bacterium]